MDVQEFELALNDLETRMDRLRALYENWFRGYEKSEPSVARKDVERRVYGLRKLLPRNTALRFRYHQLYQRFTTLANYWQRTSRQVEEGTHRLQIQRMRRKRDDLSLPTTRPERNEEGDALEPKSYELNLDETLDVGQLLDDSELDAVASAIDAPGSYHEQNGFQTTISLSAPRTAVRDTFALSDERAAGQRESARSAPKPSIGVFSKPGNAGASAFSPSLPPGGRPSEPTATRALPNPPAPHPLITSRPSEPTVTRSLPNTPERAEARAKERELLAGMSRAANHNAAAVNGAREGVSPAPREPSVARVPPAAHAAASSSGVEGSRQSNAGPLPPSPPRAVTSAAAPPRAPVRPPAPSPGLVSARPPVPPPPRAPSGGGSLGEQQIQRIYAEYVAARRRNNEGEVRYETLASSIQKMLPDLQKKHQGKRIDFEVVLKDGRVGLKPKAF